VLGFVVVSAVLCRGWAPSVPFVKVSGEWRDSKTQLLVCPPWASTHTCSHPCLHSFSFFLSLPSLSLSLSHTHTHTHTHISTHVPTSPRSQHPVQWPSQEHRAFPVHDFSGRQSAATWGSGLPSHNSTLPGEHSLEPVSALHCISRAAEPAMPWG
jgi:hypothetical protein